MEGYAVRAVFRKGLNIPSGLFYHEVGIEEKVRILTDRLHDRHPEGYGRDKDPVHNIEMKIWCAPFTDFRYLFSQMIEVCSKY